jgi:hypothetical protein
VDGVVPEGGAHRNAGRDDDRDDDRRPATVPRHRGRYTLGVDTDALTDLRERSAVVTAVAPAAPSRPPHPLSPLIGRETLLRRVLETIDRTGTRLVTLSGPGGVGKTRLALQAAREAARDGGDESIISCWANVGNGALAYETAPERVAVSGTNEYGIGLELRSGTTWFCDWFNVPGDDKGANDKHRQTIVSRTAGAEGRRLQLAA